MVKKSRKDYLEKIDDKSAEDDERLTAPPRSLATLVYSMLQCRKRIYTHPLDAASIREYTTYLTYLYSTVPIHLHLSSSILWLNNSEKDKNQSVSLKKCFVYFVYFVYIVSKNKMPAKCRVSTDAELGGEGR